MTTDLTVAHQAQASEAVEWLMPLAQSRLVDQAQRDEVEATCTALSEPAPITWTLARIASLLLPYYHVETPQGVREMEANDWADALGEYPQWAIQRAVQWWKSDDNPNRRKRPLEGDIVDRVKTEMGIVRMAKYRVMAFDRGYTDHLERVEKEDRTPVSREVAAEIMEAAGYAVKRMEAAE